MPAASRPPSISCTATEAVVSVTVLGPHRLVSHMRQGDAAPLYATSGGKVLLAYMAKEQRDAYLTRVQIRKTLPNSIDSVKALHMQLDQIRKEGVGYSSAGCTVSWDTADITAPIVEVLGCGRIGMFLVLMSELDRILEGVHARHCRFGRACVRGCGPACHRCIERCDSRSQVRPQAQRDLDRGT